MESNTGKNYYKNSISIFTTIHSVLITIDRFVAVEMIKFEIYPLEKIIDVKFHENQRNT